MCDISRDLVGAHAPSRSYHPVGWNFGALDGAGGTRGTPMALAAVLLSLGACRLGWTQLGSRCVYATEPVGVESACVAKCASVVNRPWVQNDTG